MTLFSFKAALPAAPSSRRYYRSAFNGARQLTAQQRPDRYTLVLLGLLLLGLVVALGVIAAMYLCA